MVAFSFKQQFAAPILSGAKHQTIRAIGKRQPPWPGDELQLYTGMRTKYCRLIGRARCWMVEPIVINLFDDTVELDTAFFQTAAGLDGFAEKDGFDSWTAMKAFWAREHPGEVVFTGRVIRWVDFVVGP